MANKKDESKKTQLYLQLENVHPFEGAYLFERFMREEKERPLTWTTTTSFSLFGETEEDVQAIDLEIAPGIFGIVNWGTFYIPDIEGELKTSYCIKNNLVSFQINANIDSRQKHTLQSLIEEFKSYIITNSLYKGKAIELKAFNQNNIEAPAFIKTGAIKSDEYILNGGVEQNINSSIFTIIKNYRVCKEAEVPIKRGILLTGPYGTGKTLVARQTAKVCADNDWTFIMIKDPKELANAFAYSRRFSPAVVFVEDIDAAFTSNHRDSKTNEFLNTFDNIYSKDSDTIFIMTTNHPEQLSKPMLRPGRVDCVVQFELPNVDSVEKLITYFSKSYLLGGCKEVSVKLAFQNITPAVIRELVERAKLLSISKNGRPHFQAHLLETLYESMGAHLKLLEEAIDLGVKKKGTSIEEKIDRIEKRIRQATGG